MMPPQFLFCSHVEDMGVQPRAFLSTQELGISGSDKFIAVCPICMRAAKQALAGIDGLRRIFQPTLRNASWFPARQITEDGDYTIRTVSNGKVLLIEFATVRKGVAYFGIGGLPVSQFQDDKEAEGPMRDSASEIPHENAQDSCSESKGE